MATSARSSPSSASVAPCGQPDLGLHQIDAGYRLGHRVLDLQARIGFDENEWLRTRAAGDVDQELERAEIAVADAAREPHRRVDDLASQVVVQRRRGRDLDDLLETALDAAFAFAQMRDAAGRSPRICTSTWRARGMNSST